MLLDGASIAQTTSISMAVAAFVAGCFVYNIENPKDCKHFPSFVSSNILGIKYEKGETQKSKSLNVKLNEAKISLRYMSA